jgi:hypothetical protein
MLQQKYRSIASIPLYLFGAVGLHVVAWAILEYPKVEFVIPENFHGPFIVFEDPNGHDAEERWKRTIIHVPPNGVVRVRSTAFFYYPSIYTARRESGQIVPLGNQAYEVIGEPLPPAAFWCRGSSEGFRLGECYGPRDEFFVGTRREFEDFDFEQFLPGIPRADCRDE